MFEKQISQIQSEETNTDKYFVFNYNCLKYDYYEEPSIAIVSAMLDKIEEERLFGEKTEEFLKSAWGKAKGKIAEIAGEFLKNKIGINLVELVKDINDDAQEDKEKKYDFDKMFSFKKTLTSTREKIDNLAKEKSIIFIVDELDRCLPSYAIKVLERLHHLFEGIDVRTQEKLIFRAKLNHENIFNEEIVNPALLCFELLWVVFSYKNYGSDLRWIPEINKALLFRLVKLNFSYKIMYCVDN